MGSETEEGPEIVIRTYVCSVNTTFVVSQTKKRSGQRSWDGLTGLGYTKSSTSIEGVRREQHATRSHCPAVYGVASVVRERRPVLPYALWLRPMCEEGSMATKVQHTSRAFCVQHYGTLLRTRRLRTGAKKSDDRERQHTIVRIGASSARPNIEQSKNRGKR